MFESWACRLDISEHYGRTGWLVLALTALVASSLVMAAALVGDSTVVAQLPDLQDRRAVARQRSFDAMEESSGVAVPHETPPMVTSVSR